MSFLPNLPPSVLVKQNDDDSKTKLTKEDFKKMKELEEARKSAQVPAMKDELGRDINPHIPQYIMQAPWFYNSLTPTLRHQRLPEDKQEANSSLSEVIAREKLKASRKETIVTRFREGSCENCGGLGHSKRDCCEKPRIRLAKYENKPMIALDFNSSFKTPALSYDAKRDRYKDYDNSEHALVIERYTQKEELRKQKNAKELEEKLKSCDEPERKAIFMEAGEDENRTGEDMDMPGQKFDAKQRQSIRNLRLREDTPKYLMNLNPDSAYYDPKTRAMRGNPFEHTGKSGDEVPFAGDNYVRLDNDAKKMLEAQVFSWEMSKKGINIHVQADPTRVEMLARQVSAASKTVKSKINEDILNTYGGEEFLEPPPKEIIYGYTEAYYEYDVTGRQIKGPQRQKVRSRYDEDIYRYNHTTVWGSYWNEGKWGYKCCYSLEKMSCCVGRKESISKPVIVNQIEPKKRKKEEILEVKSKRRRSSSSEDDAEADYEKKVQLEMKKQIKQAVDMEKSENNRSYNCNYTESKAPSEEQMEAYRRLKSSKDDPMSKYL